MVIKKRNGELEEFNIEKIFRAVNKCFSSVYVKKNNISIPDGIVLPKYIEKDISSIVEDVETICKEKCDNENGCLEIEEIQDIVEKSIAARGCYDESKAYVLYREKRSEMRKLHFIDKISDIVFDLKDESIEKIEEIKKYFKLLLKSQEEKFSYSSLYSMSRLHENLLLERKKDGNLIDNLKSCTKAALELTSSDAPKWEYIAGGLEYFTFMVKNFIHDRMIKGFTIKESKLSNVVIPIYDYEKIKEKIIDEKYEHLIGQNIIYLFEKFEEKILNTIDFSRNYLLSYSSIDLLLSRYSVKDEESNLIIEDPQMIFMRIAFALAFVIAKKIPCEDFNGDCEIFPLPISDNLIEEVFDKYKEFYDMYSLLKVTMATPTIANCSLKMEQLSSCFVDVVPDSLTGIYRSITNFAKISKQGGGMGLYFGKVRASGSPIKNRKGASGGVIRWVRLVNDTAVAVDQLGVRLGSCAVYLDIWHKDIPDFLNLRTNNGDDRLKAHDIFPGICYPDLFWKKVNENLDQDWYLFCPYEIHKYMGFRLEDYYGREWEEKYEQCINCKELPRVVIPLKDLVRMIIKSSVETGTPFSFFRDTVNEMNPNKHEGIIYCSNLCTEIAQNMSPINEESCEYGEERMGCGFVHSVTIAGDFVTCNLASITLGNIDNFEELRECVRNTVDALNSVIDLNHYPIPYARYTASQYRPIGIGVSGLNHYLIKRGISWESKEREKIEEELFEKINFWAIERSCEIAKEKGERYKYFEGSDWESGAYFEKRGYGSVKKESYDVYMYKVSYVGDDKWDKLKEDVKKYGIYNGYLMAIAPTASTSIISGTTPGVDPVMNKWFLEEKRGMMIVRVAPGLNKNTSHLYKAAHDCDQLTTIKLAGLRQRHVDQAQSVNLYITNNYSMREILNLMYEAWRNRMKSIYYMRSKSLEVSECEGCAN